MTGTPGFIDALYEAALAPDGWPSVLERLATLLGGVSACLSKLDLQTGRGPCLCTAPDPAWLARYQSHYCLVNPFLPKDHRHFIANWKLAVLTENDKLNQSDLRRTEFYNDFMKPQGVGGFLFVRIGLDANVTTTISIGRSLTRAAFSREQRARACALQHHLVRAVQISEQIASVDGARRDLTEVIATSPRALFIVEADGKIRHASPPAERLLASARGLQTMSGRLRATDPAADARLANLITAATSSEDTIDRAGTLSLAGPGGASPLSVSISPLPASRIDLFCQNSAAMICVSDTRLRTEIPPETLVNLFSLTPSEARIAAALSAGRPIRGIADDLGISPNTIRVHLSRVFEKTGASRQAELTAMLAQIGS